MSKQFLDVGCKQGGSMNYIRSYFGIQKGIGIDINEEHIKIAKSKGNNAIVGDATDLSQFEDNTFDVVGSMHLLEHLNSISDVKKCIDEMYRVSKDIIFIRFPYFDGDEELAKLGYRFNWSGWKGHKTHIKTDDVKNMLEGKDYTIEYLGHVGSTMTNTILPITADSEELFYSSKLGPKKDISIDLHSEVQIIIKKKGE